MANNAQDAYKIGRQHAEDGIRFYAQAQPVEYRAAYARGYIQGVPITEQGRVEKAKHIALAVSVGG